MLIEILGVIGIGKSTLLRAFPDEDYVKVQEPVEDNPWLAPFYAELSYLQALRKVGNLAPARTTPIMEVYLQARRKNEIFRGWQKDPFRPIVTDYGRPGAFARLLHNAKIISDLDYKTFLEVQQATEFTSTLRTVFYLDGIERAFENMRKRARPCELGVSLEYLKDLDTSYREELGKDAYYIPWGNGHSDINQIRAILQELHLSSVNDLILV